MIPDYARLCEDYLRAPERKQAVTASAGVVKSGGLPLVSAAGCPDRDDMAG